MPVLASFLICIVRRRVGCVPVRERPQCQTLASFRRNHPVTLGKGWNSVAGQAAGLQTHCGCSSQAARQTLPCLFGWSGVCRACEHTVSAAGKRIPWPHCGLTTLSSLREWELWKVSEQGCEAISPIFLKMPLAVTRRGSGCWEGCAPAFS